MPPAGTVTTDPSGTHGGKIVFGPPAEIPMAFEHNEGPHFWMVVRSGHHVRQPILDRDEGARFAGIAQKQRSLVAARCAVPFNLVWGDDDGIRVRRFALPWGR